MDNRIIDKAKLIIRKIWHVTPIYRRKKQVEEFRLSNEWHRVNPQMEGEVCKIEEQLDIHRFQYQISNPRILNVIQGFLDSFGITEKDSIIDIGCGKGGMLAWFAKYGFGKVVGMEYREDLCRQAEDFLAVNNISASVIRADAYLYEQYDEFNYFYLYNPFDKQIMERFVYHLDKSLNRQKRRIVVIYANALCKESFVDAGYRIHKKVEKNDMDEIVVLEK